MSGGLIAWAGMKPAVALAMIGLMGSVFVQERPPLPSDSLPARLPEVLPIGLEGELPPATPASIALGRSLFFDPLLSLDRSVSCASCHEPQFGFASDRAVSVGVGGRTTLRNAPTLFNRAFAPHHMWDGRAPTLAAQALLPIGDEREMGLGVDAAIERLNASASYRDKFQMAFAGPADAERLGQALAAFVSRLTIADSPIDRFRVENDFAALTNEERSGLWFFESRGRCWRCHIGPNFSDEDFHNTGVGVRDGVAEPGRFAHTALEADRGKFKTPTLRALALTAPYMHDGSLARLEDVIAFYRRGGNSNPGLDPALAPIEMTDADAANLLAFLRALSRQAEPRADGR